MDFVKFSVKSKAAKVGVLVALFVAVMLIAFFTVDWILDFLVEEQIRSDINSDLGKSHEMCEGFTSIEECVDYWKDQISK